MVPLSCALALLSGAIGAGFASGRELAHFFAAYGHGAWCAAAVCACCFPLLLTRLCRQMALANTASPVWLCRLRFGNRFGRLCAALFALLFALTGGAMLCACAELFALTLPLRGAYTLGLFASLLAGAQLARRGIGGLALPGAALCALLPGLLLRLLALPGGEAGFAPAGNLFASACSGAAYAALNTAMLLGTLPLLLRLGRAQQARAIALFTLLFGALLALGIAVLLRHKQQAPMQMLPFVSLCRVLGRGGYWLCALSLYAAALSTLCAMLTGLAQMRPGTKRVLPGALCCLLLSAVGFGGLISRGYPVLGALCAALMALLCLPHHQQSSSAR